MNSKEKFHLTLNFDDHSKNIKAEFGYWAGTIRNWFKRGLLRIKDIDDSVLDGDLVRGTYPITPDSNELVDLNVIPYFGLDSYLTRFPFDISPMLKEKIIEENSNYKIFTDNYGITKKIYKKNVTTPMILDHPIKNSDDFYNYIERYDDNYQNRLPDNWENLINILKKRDFPIRLGGNPYGFSFLPRYLMGDVGFMISMHDNPKLIKEFNRYFLNFVMNYWSIILNNVDIDAIVILEDIAYRSGSFISKEMFYEFMAPFYIRFIDFLKQYGIKNIIVDSDGLIDELIPLWIEVGITGIFPIEAVNDILDIRSKYPELQLLGGVDKKILFKNSTKDIIDAEIEKISILLKKGGYIPHIDHAVSQDCTWENFKYYRRKLNDLIDCKDKY